MEKKTISLHLNKEEYTLLMELAKNENGGNLNKYIRNRLFKESEMIGERLGRLEKFLLEILKHSAISSEVISEIYLKDEENKLSLEEIKSDFKDYLKGF